MLRIANDCATKGHEVTIYTGQWRGDMPKGNIHVVCLPYKGWTNHQRYKTLIAAMHKQLELSPADLVLGFNRMPGLDAYFAADPCFIEHAHKDRGYWYQLSGRYRFFAATERAVAGEHSHCKILLLSPREKAIFQRWYHTPESRFYQLPPYISAERMILQDKAEMRHRLRREFGFAEHDYVLLMVGSGFRTKGLDRAIQALAALPAELREVTRLLAVGQDNPKSFNRLAASLGIAAQVHISSGRDDIPLLMQGADLLLHPARRELAGHVLLEAMASGLPVLVSDVCGYAMHIEQAGAGRLLSSPFRQQELNEEVVNMLLSADREHWGAQGVHYASALMAANDGGAEANILAELGRHKQQFVGNAYALL